MRARLGLKVLGLCALVMSATAIGTSSAAQAEAGACFGYADAILGLRCFGEVLEAKTEPVFENNTATFLINNLNLEVLCTTAASIEGGTLSTNGSILSGRIEFGGCISLSTTPTLTKLIACTPNDPVAGLGKIRTEKGTGLIVLHNGEPVISLGPSTGTTLVRIFLGEECSLSEELIVQGKLILQDAPLTHVVEKEGKKETVVLKTAKEQSIKHMITHLMQEFPGLKLMTVGVNKATIDGTAVVRLFFPHAAHQWAIKAS